MNIERSACAAILAVTAAFSAVPAHAQTKITYATIVSGEHSAIKHGLMPMFENITKATNGDLEFEVFLNGAMGGGKAMLSIVRDRLVDSSTIVSPYIRSDLPASAMIIDLGALGDDAMVMAGAVNEFFLLHCAECNEELARNNVKPLASYSTTPYLLMCTEPLSSLDDIKGRKVRASASFGAAVAALGAVPVNIGAGEVYEAMLRGQIDCNTGGAYWMTSYNLKDSVKGILDLSLGTYAGTYIFDMNTRTWAGLPVEERALIIRELPGAVRRIVEGYVNDDEQAIEETVALGAMLSPPDAAVVSRYQEHRESFKQDIVTSAEEYGLANAARIADDYLAIIDKWSNIVASFNDQENPYDQFERALWDEVFSKLPVD